MYVRRSMPFLVLALATSLTLAVSALGFAAAGSSPAAAQKSAPDAAEAPTLEKAPEDTFSGVARTVAIGDVHGDVSALRTVLKLAGLIDAADHWIGGKTHLVQTGDVPDRDDHTRAALDLLMRLEKEAPLAGGRVHSLLGNHEVMNMDGDLRYLTPLELASYADLSPTPDAPGKPKGSAGHAMAFSIDGRYGRWLRTRPAVVKVNETLFLHGGIAPTVTAPTLSSLNRWIRQDLFVGNPVGGARLKDGPLWYRGYALESEDSLRAGLDGILERYRATRMVMGHTTTRGEITQRFGGKAIFIDTGISANYGSHFAALELKRVGKAEVGGTKTAKTGTGKASGQNDSLTALYPNRQVPLVAPTGNTPPVR